MFDNVYLNDIIERNNLCEDSYIDQVVDALVSSVDSQTNPNATIIFIMASEFLRHRANIL